MFAGDVIVSVLDTKIDRDRVGLCTTHRGRVVQPDVFLGKGLHIMLHRDQEHA